MATPAAQLTATDEIVELWAGEVVVKGQPSPGHEALRAEIIKQLCSQPIDGTAVLASSTAGDDQIGYAVSDGSIVDVTGGGSTPVWVEVLSASDLRKDDQRLIGEIRRQWVFDHGVDSLWMFLDALGVVTLTVLHADGREGQAAVSPATATVTVRHAGADHDVVIDLGALARAARRVADR